MHKVHRKGDIMAWNWNVTDMGTLQIFNGNALYWEYEGFKKYKPKQIQNFVNEVIEDFYSWKDEI